MCAVVSVFPEWRLADALDTQRSSGEVSGMFGSSKAFPWLLLHFHTKALVCIHQIFEKNRIVFSLICTLVPELMCSTWHNVLDMRRALASQTVVTDLSFATTAQSLGGRRSFPAKGLTLLKGFHWLWLGTGLSQGKPRMLISGKGQGCGTLFESLRRPSFRIRDIQMERGGNDMNEPRPETIGVISASQTILHAVVAIQ